MTTAPESADRHHVRTRRLKPRMVIIGAIGGAVLCAVVWQSVVARQRVRIPLTGELLQQPEGDLLASLKAQGLDNITIDEGCLVVATGDEPRCRQILQELSAHESTWADEWERANDQLTPFSSASERSAAREIARTRRISQMLSQMPGIEHADVVWDEQPGRGFRQEATVRATVYIRPSADEGLTSEVIESIREAVAGSKANLDSANVVVMDLSTGMTHLAATAEPVGAEPLETAVLEDVTTTSSESQDPPRTGIACRHSQDYYRDLSIEVPPFAWWNDELNASSLAEVPVSSMYLPPVHELHSIERSVPTLLQHTERLAYPLGHAIYSSFNAGVTSSSFSWASPVEGDDGTEQDNEIVAIPDAATPGIAFDLTEHVEVADVDDEGAANAVAASAMPQPAQPHRNRQARSADRDAESGGYLGIDSESDIRFLVWVGIGIVVLIAALRGILHRPASVEPPSMSLQLGQDSRSDSDADGPRQDQPVTLHRKSNDDAGQGTDQSAAMPNFVSTTASPTVSADNQGDALAAFDHLAWLDGESIQKLYRCLPDEPWALALSGASMQIQEHVLKSLPRSSCAMLQRRMDSLPAIRLRDVEEAQRRLGEWVRKLGDPANVQGND